MKNHELRGRPRNATTPGGAVVEAQVDGLRRGRPLGMPWVADAASLVHDRTYAVEGRHGHSLGNLGLLAWVGGDRADDVRDEVEHLVVVKGGLSAAPASWRPGGRAHGATVGAVRDQNRTGRSDRTAARTTRMKRMPSSSAVVINLPPPRETPAYRESLSRLAEYVVQDFGSSVTVEPREGAGATRQHFTAHRLCGDGDALSDATWQPLRDHPLRDHDRKRAQSLVNWAQDYVAKDPTNLQRVLRAFRACVFALGNQLPSFLQQQMPGIFRNFPGSSLWFVSADPVLLTRFTFLRTQLALTLTPDIPFSGPGFDGLQLLDSHSLTGGLDFGYVHAPPLLAYSPGVVGYPMSCPPHALVLFLGQTMDLRKPDVPIWDEILRPRTLDRPDVWNDADFWGDLDYQELEATLPWWVERLNILYSHATDPTDFQDELGRHDAAAQMAWFLTLERMLADGILLLSDARAGAVVRMQLAFDLLDKAETLLGYSLRDSGLGFMDLLRRGKTVPRLKQAWASLPGGLAKRFCDHTELAYDLMYEDVREHALQHRLTRNGMRVARDDPAQPTPMTMDEYVPELVRAVRNSSHGLSEVLQGKSALLVATHEGRMPSQLSDVAALAMLGLVADADRLRNGTWW